MEKEAKEKNQQLYKPCSNGKKGIFRYFSVMNVYCTVPVLFWPLSPTRVHWLFVLILGIIAKEQASSLQQEIQELRGSPSGLPSVPEFELADIFYFCRTGVESILDDEVTKRFSAQELEGWNLLTRSNYNFRHISVRLTVLWGLGVLIRYGVLLPLRSEQLVCRLCCRGGKIHLICWKRRIWNVFFFFCRVTLAVVGICLLLVLTTLVGFLPNKE